MTITKSPLDVNGIEVYIQESASINCIVSTGFPPMVMVIEEKTPVRLQAKELIELMICYYVVWILLWLVNCPE